VSQFGFVQRLQFLDGVEGRLGSQPREVYPRDGRD
jgi:hypothetical protein